MLANLGELVIRPTSRSSTPIPYDAVRETQVQFAPFDVDYGQFTGCAINVVTKQATLDYDFARVNVGVGTSKFVPVNETYFTNYPTADNYYEGPWWWWSNFKFIVSQIKAQQ